jgi:2-polyprenyl-3-methyl-5-hydroxy-6-metoxy-1,4-benzoquinol methylase
MKDVSVNMTAKITPKETSYAYGEAYQRQQVTKHRERRTNHWQKRIALAHRMVDEWVLPRFEGRPPSSITVIDVGCSIGTMAIEFALRGFRTRGVDFDGSALVIARELCREEQVAVEFYQCDVADLQKTSGEMVDVALCFDIFEHLHDDELGAMLQAIRRQMNPQGSLVFYSFPLQFDYLFFSRDFLNWPLVPFRWLSPKRFQSITRAYASLLDAGLLLTTGQSYAERIKKQAHCNPTTPARLQNILTRAGYDVACLETTDIYSFKPSVRKRFARQPIVDRQVFGVAYKRAN